MLYGQLYTVDIITAYIREDFDLFTSWSQTFPEALFPQYFHDLWPISFFPPDFTFCPSEGISEMCDVCTLT